ncbi:MAG: hypothetical protein INR68_17825 [Methylobacterium mesophilicum]|nr:hypothetical protein [Methylobacterium mesophilicum]
MTAAVIAGRATAPSISDRRGEAARLVGTGAAILGASVLADSAIEHYEGEYHNPAMFVAPLAAAAVTAAALSEPGPPAERPKIPSLAGALHLGGMAVGVSGLGFHLFNIGKRPGGFSWPNLFYGAPFGAPGALCLAGLFGFLAKRLGGSEAEKVIDGNARLLAGLTGASLLATTAEVAVLHFRGAFQNRAMYLPVIVPPITGVALLGQAMRPAPQPLTRAFLWVTGALGLIGTGFHAYGVGRSMGGWRNWRQNLLAGPPMPAPISFTGLALAGLAALRLGGDAARRREARK